MSSGRDRKSCAAGSPTHIATTPEITAVSRQPKVVMDHATTGARSAPEAKPTDVSDMALARLRMNQCAIVVLTVRNPAMLVPIAMMLSATNRCQSSLICPIRMSPPPKRSVPILMTGRGPKRSIIMPCTGPRNPVSMRSIPKAHAMAPRLHANAASNSTT